MRVREPAMYYFVNLTKEKIMSKNDKNKKEIRTSEGNDVIFPLMFGIIATILMAIISHFIGG